MGVKIKELIEKLQEQQNQEKEVEYIICDKKGELVAVDVQTQAKPMRGMLKLF